MFALLKKIIALQNEYGHYSSLVTNLVRPFKTFVKVVWAIIQLF